MGSLMSSGAPSMRATAASRLSVITATWSAVSPRAPVGRDHRLRRCNRLRAAVKYSHGSALPLSKMLVDAQLSSFLMHPTLFFLAAQKRGISFILEKEEKHEQCLNNNRFDRVKCIVGHSGEGFFTILCVAETSHPTSGSILSCFEGETSAGSTNG